jgi:hypothetical protein
VLPVSETPFLNVEGLSDARTLLAGFFSILIRGGGYEKPKENGGGRDSS